MSGTSKWDDAAVKDLIMAILMSANNGNLNISANWDKVNETMTSWGYGFSKSAMSQQWTKKIVKQFKDRHDNIQGSGDASPKTPKTPKKTATPVKRATPKTPGTGRGKKRVAVNDNDDDDTWPRASDMDDQLARHMTSRSAKKVKYEEDGSCDSEAKAENLSMGEDEAELK